MAMCKLPQDILYYANYMSINIIVKPHLIIVIQHPSEQFLSFHTFPLQLAALLQFSVAEDTSEHRSTVFSYKLQQKYC